MKLILLLLNLSTWVQSLGFMWQEARIDSYLCLTAKIILAASCSCPTLSPLFLFLPTLLLLLPLYFPLLQNPVWLSLQGSCASASWKTGLQRTCFPFSLGLNLSFPQPLTSPAPSYLCCPPLIYLTAFNQQSYWFFSCSLFFSFISICIHNN